MQLEKANSQDGEAGLAGWISSNDVTLFTVVMVVVIAIFMHANVIKGSKREEKLKGQKASLNDLLSDTDGKLRTTEDRLLAAMSELDQTGRQLKTTIEQLEATKTELDTTKKERDALEEARKKLDQELKAKLADVKKLSETLDALNVEKTNLLATRDQLTKEKGDLTKQKEDLTETKAKLDEGLAELTAKLKERLGQLDDLEKERDLLDQKAKALADRVARLQTQLGDSENNLAEFKESSQSELEKMNALLAQLAERHKQDQAVSAKDLQSVMDRAKAADAKVKEYSDWYLGARERIGKHLKKVDEEKATLQLQVDVLKVELANALDDLKERQQQLTARVAKEKTLNRELVGLRGGLRRVAILFDSSGSMEQSGRWEEVQRIASTWLDYLEVDECVLIVFSSEATAFPADGTMIRVSGPDGDASRVRLMTHLRSVKPKGWTNTLAAMQKAYEYEDLDTIILFSDGAPTYENRNDFNADAAEQIYALCREHSDVPVNAIGLGDYFDEALSTFLRTVAHTTGGTFLGR